MNNTRPRSASRRRSDLQNCSNRLVGTCESHAEKKITSKRAVVAHANTSATSNVTFGESTPSRAIAIISGAASIALTVDAQRANAAVQMPVPHAISKTSPTRPHLRNQPCDALRRRGHIAIGSHVVLDRTLAVVTHLLRENLVDHCHIMNRDPHEAQGLPILTLKTRLPKGGSAPASGDPFEDRLNRIASGCVCG